MAQKRLSDKGRQVLRKGEGQRSNGSYYYRWTDQAGERHTIYSKSLTVLREREKELDLDKADGIKYEAMYVTINDVYKLWKDLKRGLKNNTFENYKYMYETFVAPTFGKERINRITMNIYADVTKELREKELGNLEACFAKQTG